MGENGSLCTLVGDVVGVLVGQTPCWGGEGGVCEAVDVVGQAEQGAQRSLCEQEGGFAESDSSSGWPGASAASSWE